MIIPNAVMIDDFIGAEPPDDILRTQFGCPVVRERTGWD